MFRFCFLTWRHTVRRVAEVVDDDKGLVDDGLVLLVVELSELSELSVCSSIGS